MFGVASPLRVGGSLFERVVYSESPSNSAEPNFTRDFMFGLGLGYRVGKLSVELGVGIGGGNGGFGVVGSAHGLGRYWLTPTLYAATQVEVCEGSALLDRRDRVSTNGLIGAGTSLGANRRWFVEALVGAGKTNATYTYPDREAESLELRGHVRIGLRLGAFAPRR